MSDKPLTIEKLKEARDLIHRQKPITPPLFTMTGQQIIDCAIAHDLDEFTITRLTKKHNVDEVYVGDGILSMMTWEEYYDK